MASAEDNIPEYSVSELAQGVRRTLETAFARVRVRGEISGFKQYASGHGYFTLKDADAAISAVMWRANVARLAFRPEDGLEVVALGRVSAYPKNSRFQVIVERMEVAGVGALLKQIEERRQRLAAEGLFRPETKPRPPFIPHHIGVVTSPKGAVIRDIMHRLNDRFPRRVTLWPAPVQGDDAARRITAAIVGFNAMTGAARPDLLIVARGGGSIEDLMPFNDEVLVRAAAASRIPLISAVGHETDTMLIDYAAALRAPTPSAAAELAVPVRAELVAEVTTLAARADRARRRAFALRRERIGALTARIPRPAQLLGLAGQRLDDAGARLALAIRRRVDDARVRVGALAARVPPPKANMVRARERLQALDGRLALAMRQRMVVLAGRIGQAAGRLQPGLLVHLLERQRARLAAPKVTPNPAFLRARLAALRERLAARMQLIESLSPLTVMKRGFALVRDDAGALVTRAATARAAHHLQLQFADGVVTVAPKGPGGARGGGPSGQGSLW